MVIDILLIGISILAIIVSLSMLAHIFVVVPYVPTKKKVMAEMLRLADLQDSQTVVDLGAGDGRLLVAAKQQCPGITAIGFEFIPTIWLYGKCKVWFSGQDIDLRWGDMFGADLRQAHVIFLYLFPDVMRKLKPKFDDELQPGTKVVSHAFVFKDKEPEEVVMVQDGKRERKVFVYQW